MLMCRSTAVDVRLDHGDSSTDKAAPHACLGTFRNCSTVLSHDGQDATHVLVAADQLLKLLLGQWRAAAVAALDVDAVPVRLEVLPLLRLAGEAAGLGVQPARHAAAGDRCGSCRCIATRLPRLRCGCRRGPVQ